MKIGIIDAGSSVNKVLIYEDGVVIDSIKQSFPFKVEYSKSGTISSKLLNEYVFFITELENKVDKLYILGAGFYRALSSENLKLFTDAISVCSKTIFRIITAEEEQLYTLKGAIVGRTLDNYIFAVTGGSSTELSYCEKESIIDNCNNSIGGVYIYEVYPGVSDDVSSIDINVALDCIINKFKYDLPYSELLILAGGDHVASFSCLFDLEKNNYQFSADEVIEMCKSIYNFSYSSLKLKSKVNNLAWMTGLRERLVCIIALIELSKVKKVIITSANTASGYYEEVK